MRSSPVVSQSVSQNRRLALACTATKMCSLQKRAWHRKHIKVNKRDVFVGTETSPPVSAIYYQPFSPPDSFNLINKPDQTKATCHNNHRPTTFRHGLGRNIVSVGLRLFFGKIHENNLHIHCPNSHSSNFGLLNLPFHRHTWLSPSHNTVRLQETARGRAGTNILARESVECVPLVCHRKLIGPLPPKPAAFGYFIGSCSNPSHLQPLLGGMRSHS